MKSFKFLSLFLALGLMIASCGSDPDPITINSIEAVGTSFEDGSEVKQNLNGATSATDVALNSTITATFDKAPTNASASNIKITGADGDVPSTVTSSGTTVTIKPNADLMRGTLYTLSMNGLVAEDEGELPSSSRTFTTEGRAPVVVPLEESMAAYWSFDNTVDDATGQMVTSKTVAVTYGTDRFGQGNSTASFDGDETIIEIADADQLLDGQDFTLSFWVKTNSDGHVDAGGNPAGHFVMGLAAFKGFQFEIPSSYTSCKLAAGYELADGSIVFEDTWFPGDGNDAENGGWQGWDYVADLTGSGGVEGLIQDKWAHIICVYNAAERQGRMYINGELMKSWDFDLWPEADGKRTAVGVGYGGAEPSELPELAFGFIHSSGGELWDAEPWGSYELPTSNHFKGDLDDVRIFKAPYSAADAKALYDAEKN